MWTHFTQGNHDLNNLELTLPENASIEILSLLSFSLWESDLFLKIPAFFNNYKLSSLSKGYGPLLKFNSHNPVMLCVKLSWNRLSGSKEDENMKKFITTTTSTQSTYSGQILIRKVYVSLLSDEQKQSVSCTMTA